MRILMIGGTGFIGSQVTKQFLDERHQVAIISRSNLPEPLVGRVSHFQASMEELGAIRQEIQTFSPEITVHMVMYTEEHAQEAVLQLTGTTERIIAISSGDVYRNYDGLRNYSEVAPDPTPLDENSPLRSKLYPYRDVPDQGWQYQNNYEKILVEQTLLNQNQIQPTILRLGAVYGPGDPQHRFREYVRRMKARRPYILLEQGQLNWKFTHIDVTSVSDAIFQVSTTAKTSGKLFNIGEPVTPTVGERIQQIAQLLEWRGEVIEVPSQYLPQHLQMGFNWRYHMEISSQRYSREVSGVQSDRDTTLQQTIKWEFEHLPGTSSETDQQRFTLEDEAAAFAI